MLRRGTGQGGVRHRDAGARHQHAGPHRRDREADQVHRRAPRVPDARASTRSSPAGPAGGASTTAGPRRRAVVAVRARSARWPAWPSSRTLHAHLGLPADLQHGRQPGAALRRPTQAHHLLNLSFAQFQADQAVVRLETRLARREAALAEVRAEADVRAGRRRRVPRRWSRRRAAADAAATAPRRRHQLGAGRAGLSRLRPGDVIQQPGRNADAPLAVLSVARRKGGAVRLRVLTKRRRVRQPGQHRLRRATRGRRHGRRCRCPFAPDDRGFQQEVAERAARSAAPTPAGPGRSRPDRDRRGAGRARADADRPPAGPPGGRLPRPRPPPAGGPPGRAHRPRGRRPQAADPRPHRVAGPPVRPGPAAARGVGLPRRAGRSPAGASGWCASSTSATCSSPSALESGLLDGLDPAALAGAGVVLHLRAPQQRRRRRRRGSRRPTSSTGSPRSTQLAAELNADEEAVGPAAHPAARPGFFALAHAWVAGAAARRGPRGRGALGRRLRAQRQAAHRPAPPGRPTPPPTRPPPAPPARPPTCMFRGVVVGRRRWSRPPTTRSTGRAAVTIEKGEAWGDAGAAARRRRASCAPTPRPGRVVERGAGGPATRCPSLGLLGGDLCRTLGGPGDEARLRSADAMTFPVDLGVAARRRPAATGSSPTPSPAGRGGGGGPSRP